MKKVENQEPCRLSRESAETRLVESMAAAVLEVASKLPLPQQDRWTVLAGIVLVKSDDDDDDVIVLSVAMGTKCEPPIADAATRDYVVMDSHAEVLARRGLVLFLLNELEALARNPVYQSRVLTKTARGKYAVVGELCMFVSDSPCGYAAEFTRVGGQSRKVSGAVFVGEAALRLKPGRSDLPEHMRTRCMSCSDKLCRWAALGLQGSRLALILEPVTLASIVLGKDAVLLAVEDADLAATDRACVQEVACETVRAALEASLRRSSATTAPAVSVDMRAEFPYSRWRIDRPHPLVCLPGDKRTKFGAFALERQRADTAQKKQAVVHGVRRGSLVGGAHTGGRLRQAQTRRQWMGRGSHQGHTPRRVARQR